MHRFVCFVWFLSMSLVLLGSLGTGEWKSGMAIGLAGVCGYVLALWQHPSYPPRLWWELMGYKLHRNRHKTTDDDTVDSLFAKMEHEVIELYEVLRDGKPSMDVMLEAADVANLAFLTADKYTEGEQ